MGLFLALVYGGCSCCCHTRKNPHKTAILFSVRTAKKITKGIDTTRKKRGYKCYYVSIDRKKKYFATPAERDRVYSREIAMNELGIGHVEVTTSNQAELKKMVELSKGRSETLLEIFKVGLAALPNKKITPSEARDEFIKHKEAAVAAGALKSNSLKQQRIAVDNMLEEFKPLSFAQIKNPEFETWLRGRKMSARGLYTFSKAIGVFLNWCAAAPRGYLKKSPLAELEIAEPAPKRVIFTVEQMRRVFIVATQEFPDMVPLLALEWFAGIRPETAEQVTYENIDRKAKLIRLEVGKFDQGDAEFVEKIPLTLWQWLPKDGEGRVAPLNIKHRITHLHKALGYEGKNTWPQDVARRTFISHFAALRGSVEKAAEVANHRSKSTTLKHYRRRVPKKEGVAYFETTPELIAAETQKAAAFKVA